MSEDGDDGHKLDVSGSGRERQKGPVVAADGRKAGGRRE